MPKLQGVYRAGNGSWYFKATFGRDPLSGKRLQVTRRGFPTATDAARARRELLEQADEGALPMAAGSMTVDELLTLYLDGIDADGRLSPKTRYDYRRNGDAYVRPWLGDHQVRALTPEVVLAWQRQLSAGTGTKRGKPLTPNTVRLARASLAGAVRLGVTLGLLRTNPLSVVPRPKPRRATPKHWTPDQARAFLASESGDRLYPLWAFLLGSGLRIGELVWLRWPNVDLARRRVRIVDFATALGWDLVASEGKSVTSRRTIDLDDGLVEVLRSQAEQQRFEARAPGYETTEYMFTKPEGGSYHPQHLSKTLAELSVAAGLPRLTAHGLRHTSATLMLDQGVAPKVAAERLGHADPTLFVNLYSHVTPTMQRHAADAIGAALFGDEDAATG